jgi:hypothetical protein
MEVTNIIAKKFYNINTGTYQVVPQCASTLRKELIFWDNSNDNVSSQSTDVEVQRLQEQMATHQLQDRPKMETFSLEETKFTTVRIKKPEGMQTVYDKVYVSTIRFKITEKKEQEPWANNTDNVSELGKEIQYNSPLYTFIFITLVYISLYTGIFVQFRLIYAVSV